MKNRIALLVALLMGGVLAFSALGDVPRIMTFQGKLADTQGHYVEGQRALTFRMYDRETGGAVLWQEQQANVPVTRGIFAVPLGVYQPLNLPFDTNYWISVEVGSDGEMAPRQRLTASAYAFRAAVAEQATFATSANTATTAVHAATADLATRTLEGGNPPGTVLAFAGPTAPDGYMECDGRALASLSYPSLFAAIGRAWGAGDGTLDGQGRVKDFNLPDLRGRFLRGKDGTAGMDPDSGTRTASSTGGNTGNAVGSVQGDASAAHRHPLQKWSQPWMVGEPYEAFSSGSFSSFDWETSYIGSIGQPQISDVGYTAYCGGNETRPKNAYVVYIIKY